MKKILNVYNIYLLLIIETILAPFFNFSGTAINQFCTLCIIVFSLFYFVRIIMGEKLIYFRGLVCFVLLLSIYGFILLIGNEYCPYPKYAYLRDIYLSLLPTCTFYMWYHEDKIDDDFLRFWLWVLLAASIIAFRFQYFSYFSDYAGSRDGMTNNIGYYFLPLIPGIFLFNNKLTRYMFLSICVLFIIVGMKRGAILVAGIELIYILFYLMKLDKFSFKKILFIILFIVLLVGLVRYLVENNSYFNSRIDATLAGNSSGRDDLAKMFLKAYMEDSNVFQQIFGHGAYSTLKTAGMLAHNDWVEILFSNGIIGILFYIIYLVKFYKSSIVYNMSNDTRALIRSLFIIFFFASPFTFAYSGMKVAWGILLGCALAKMEKESYLLIK